MATAPPGFDPDRDDPPSNRPKRSWRDKFNDAWRGLKRGVRGHSSFFVHFFFAALVVVSAFALHCTLVQWCLLLGCIGVVLVAEVFNSAIEILFRGLDEATRERSWRALDIAAGAVLLASLFAALVGALVFGERIGFLCGWWESSAPPPR